jgi:hypothetical protein
VPAIVPADEAASGRRDGSMEIVMPDVDAMIDEITAQVTDPNRNPNVGDAGRQDADRDEDQDRDDRDRDDDRDRSAAENRRRSARDRINERDRRTTSATRANGDDAQESQRGSGNNGNRDNDDCDSSFENLPEDLRPQGFPFDDC